jgi:hypothetical protein
MVPGTGHGPTDIPDLRGKLLFVDDAGTKVSRCLAGYFGPVERALLNPPICS